MQAELASDADILRTIEGFCEARGMGVTTFGREAVGDPNLVSNMRNGRSLTLKTASVVMTFIADRRAAQARA